jgi:hypothetical protein
MKWALSLLVFCLSVAVFILASKVLEEKKDRFSLNIPVDQEIFEQKLATPPPEWMLAQIRSDLQPFSEKGITPQMIQDTFCGEKIAKHGLIRFTIQNGILSIGLQSTHLKQHRFAELLAGISKLNELVSLPDVDFLASAEDGFFVDPGDLSCPIFAFSKVEGLHPFILIPDCKAMKGYEMIREEIIKENKEHPWATKKSQAFWRGGANGAPITWDNWDQLPRMKLVLMSLAFPQEIDARLVNLHHLMYSPPGIKKTVKSKGMVSRWVDKADHLKYKYLVDIDGGSCTFERYFWLLLSNSVTLKQITSSRQWFYGALKPYEHYIPVNEDLSDLREKIQWAREHDEEARKIADNATEFVKNNLSPEDIYLYMYHLICEYSRLFPKPQS